MTIFNLFAYIFVVAIYAHCIFYAVTVVHVPVLLCAFFLCFPPSIVGLVMACWRGELIESLHEILKRQQRRRAFIALSLLGTAIPLVTVLAFQGSLRPAPVSIPPANPNVGTLIMTLSVLAAALFGWITSALWERARGEAHRAGPPSWRALSTVTAIGGILCFVAGLDGHLLKNPLPRFQSMLSLSWAVLAVAMLQITRTAFATQGICTASFLLWRYLGPAAVFGVWSVVLPDTFGGASSAPTPHQLQGLIAMGSAAAAVAWLQYDCLRHYPVVALVRGLLLTPMLTYLIKHGLIAPRSVKRDAQTWLALLTMLPVLASMLPWHYLQRRSVPGTVAGVWKWFRHDPITAIAAKVFYRGALATVLTLLMYLPTIKVIWEQQALIFWITMIGTALFFSVALVCRLLERLVNHRLIVVRKVMHDIVAPFDMIQFFLRQLREENLSAAEFVRIVDDLRHDFELARSLAQGLKDELRFDTPLILKLERLPLAAFLRDVQRTLEIAVLRSQVSLHVEIDPAAADVFVDIDRVRFSLVLYNLTINSVADWRKAQGADLRGLRLRWEVSLQGQHVRILVRDNGRGIPAPVARAVDNNLPGGPTLCSGLGLYLSRRAVEAHEGGRFHVAGRRANKGERQGAEITILFPTA